MRRFMDIASKFLFAIIILVLTMPIPGLSFRSALFFSLGSGTSLSLWKLSFTGDFLI